jgi:hypothetical protein
MNLASTRPAYSVLFMVRGAGPLSRSGNLVTGITAVVRAGGTRVERSLAVRP